MIKINKITKIALFVLVSFMLTACNKKVKVDTNNPEGIQTDININISNNITPPVDSSVVDEINSTEIEDKNIDSIKVESDEVKEPEDKKDEIITELSSVEKLQDALTKNNKVESFVNQLKVLQEVNLNILYNSLAMGASNLEVREFIQKSDYRYINNVTLNYLLDETGSLLNMKERKGLIVFTSSKLDLNEETSKLTRPETFAEANNKDIIIDVKNDCDFDSFVVFTFNNDNVLVGKFKYFLSENGLKKDEDILSGSLTYDSTLPLLIGEGSDIKTIYEKLDKTRVELEKLKNIKDSLTNTVKDTLLSNYEKLTDETTVEDLIKKVQENKLGIEKMSAVHLNPFNKKLLKSYTEGYYIFLTKEDSKTSSDLRYNNIYTTVIFDENNKLYYKGIVSDFLTEEVCKDIKNSEDYTLKELYLNISNLEKEVNKYKEEKKVFQDYLEKNLILLNKNIDYTFDYNRLITEIQKSGLDYQDNYKNLSVAKAKNSKSKDIQLNVDGVNIYDNCILVSSELRNIYYFIKNEKIIGIYRSDYFDISENKLKDYKNLKVIKKGLEQLKDEEYIIENEMKTYTNMVSSKLDKFISSIGLSTNSKEGQIYKQVDIIQSLDNSGFKYEEGMNKGDGLYFIGIYALKNDTKFAYKIYFNESLQVELIQ